MTLTPQDLWTLRNIAIRAINEAHEVLSTAARRKAPEAHPQAPPATAPQPTTPREPPPARLAHTIAEAGQLLSLSRASIYRLISEGDLKAIRIGSRRLIEASQIEALLAKTRTKAG